MLDTTKRRFLVIKPLNVITYPTVNGLFNKKHPVGSVVKMGKGDYIDGKIILDHEISECLRELKCQDT